MGARMGRSFNQKSADIGSNHYLFVFYISNMNAIYVQKQVHSIPV